MNQGQQERSPFRNSVIIMNTGGIDSLQLINNYIIEMKLNKIPSSLIL